MDTVTNPENEAKAAALRAQDSVKSEGTVESLARCAKMLDVYAPECFPANEHGQVDFARAMMESVADEIRAFLKASDGMISARDDIIIRQAGEIQALRAALLKAEAAHSRCVQLLTEEESKRWALQARLDGERDRRVAEESKP